MNSQNALKKLCTELNERFFNGSAQVLDVRFATFKSDLAGLGATFGLFDTATSIIYINTFFQGRLAKGQMMVQAELVLFHELCHAALTNMYQPIRYNLYHPCGGDHGEDFQKLFRQHPLHEQADETVQEIVEGIFEFTNLKIRRMKMAKRTETRKADAAAKGSEPVTKIIITCSTCSTKNRVDENKIDQARCGLCKEPLAPSFDEDDDVDADVDESDEIDVDEDDDTPF